MFMGKVFKDYPITEITLRKFERPFDEDRKSMIRKFCISIGLLQPGDSRDVVVDIVNLFVDKKNERQILSSKEIEHILKENRSEGVAGSNIRRQILRLERIGLVEKWNKGYRLREFLDLTTLLKEHIKPFLIEPTFNRILEYANKIDK